MWIITSENSYISIIAAQKEKIAQLNYLTNKSSLMKSEYQVQHGIWILIDEIEKSQTPYTIDEYWFMLTIHLPNGQNRIIYHADYGFDSSTLRRIFEDKIYTSKILRKNWFLVAEDMLVARENTRYSNPQNTTSACIQFAEKYGYPLIFKPNDGSLWSWVSKIFDKNQLLATLSHFNQSNKGMHLLQTYIPGRDYRVLYLDGEILVAYERIPPTITGDGENTIKNLIEKDFPTINQKKVEHYLETQGINTEAILGKNKTLPLLPTANIATWGTIREIKHTDHDTIFLRKIAAAFWARYFWIDIISEGELADGYILEINKSPITKWICEYSPAFKNLFSTKIRTTIQKDEKLI